MADPWYIYPNVVEVSAPAPRDATQLRRNFINWVARNFVPRAGLAEPAALLMTKNLTADEVRASPTKIVDLVRFNPPVARSIYVIDLSLNAPANIREAVWAHIGVAVTEHAASKNRLVLLLVPQLPSPVHSQMWVPLEGLSRSAGSVVVIANDGSSRAFGAPVRDVGPVLREQYPSRLAALFPDTEKRFASNLVRRLGHFKLSDDSSHCGRYFYDASDAVAELAEMICAKVREIAAKELKESDRVVLVPVASISHWLVEATTIAASRLAVPVERLGARSSAELAQVPRIAVFDFVNTGATSTAALERLKRSRRNVHHTAIAALAARDARCDVDEFKIDPLYRVDVERRASTDCVQCRLALPYTDPLRPESEPLGIRAYDFWDMLTSVEWKAEEYGPSGKRYSYMPSMYDLAVKHGDYLSWKLKRLIVSHMQVDDIVVVCPDEPAIRLLVEGMQNRTGGHIAAVWLDRKELLDRVDARDDAALRKLGNGKDWALQLKHLSGRTRVVVTDEMNASSTTIRQILRVLHAFNVEAAWYVPVFDRMLDERLDVRVRTLYRVPSPRVGGA